jgi:environmental stress-induced protein Ves
MIKKFGKTSYKTTFWSGGKTRELFIYPPNSSYLNRDFLFRISSATIEISESTFTKLPNISRKIMILEGNLKLSHKNHHQKYLTEFEQDSFSGDWTTKSKGKAKDFNLMTTKNCDGILNHITILKNGHYSVCFQNSDNNKIYHLYLFEGKLLENDEKLSLNKDESLLILNESIINLEFSAEQLSHLIISKITI